MTDKTTTEDAKTMGQSLDLRDLHAANIARQAEWCPDQVPDLSFRGNELGGECGEAQNVIKKLERERQGWRGSRATKDDLADELADVVICADLCAVTADIDLGAAVLRKFNATSEKQGLSVFLPSAPALAAPRADSAERTAREEPRVFKDGDAWCCLLGEDLQDGIAGFGKTPDAARRNFRERLTGNLCSVLRGALTVADENLREIARDVTGTDWLLEQEAEGRGPLAVIKRALELSPAPSSPGVPDSVRALSEAATQGDLNVSNIADGWRHTICAGPMWRVIAQFERQEDAEFFAAAGKHVRTTISAHPAGQSTGQGAEDVSRDFQMMLARIIYRHEKGLSISNTIDNARDLLKRKGTLSPFRDTPAPDSTRTGQVETAALADLEIHLTGPALYGPDAAKAALEWVNTNLSTHTTKQSEQPILRATVDVFADRTDTRLAFGDRTAPEPGVKAVQQAIAALTAEYEARGGCPVVGRHPAGQSTGQGAERLTRAELEPHINALEDWLVAKGGLGAWAAGTASRRLLLAEDSPLCLKPAPDSTRTGQVETDNDEFDRRVQAALAAWKEAQDTATVDEHQEDTDFGAMMCAVAAADAVGLERVRHVKRGTEYAVLGVAEAQVSCRADGTPGSVRGLYDGCRLTIYRGSDGKLWCRFADEFSDGRFLTLAARQAAPEAQGAEHPDDSTIGTAVQAIEWAIGIDDHYDRLDFLKDWSEGNLTEWADFATFVHGNRPAPPPSSGQESAR